MEQKLITDKPGTKVFIYSIPRETATRVDAFTDDNSGRKLKKTKIGRCRDTIQALYNPKFGGLANGLSYKPWTENGEQKVDPETGKKLTLQDKMEQKWGLEPGYLTNRPWRRGDSYRTEDMTYFQRASWKLNDGATVLDLSNFDDEMFYYVCLDSKFVANSEREWRSHQWPKATHYIALQNEAEEIKYKRNEMKSKAFAALHSSDMTPTAKKQFIHILELASTRANVTEEQVNNLLFDYIDSSSFTPGNNIDKFTELYDLLTTATGREELSARHLLKKAVDARVVYEKQGAYTWNKASGPITIGERYSEAVEFLLNPKKQSLVEELEEELKAKLV